MRPYKPEAQARGIRVPACFPLLALRAWMAEERQDAMFRVYTDKKPRAEARGHRAFGRSRICMARGMVCAPGVPRLPPGACMRP